MLWDLGGLEAVEAVDRGQTDAQDKVKRTISKLEADFDLVLIAERFEESMILLRGSRSKDKQKKGFLLYCSVLSRSARLGYGRYRVRDAQPSKSLPVVLCP